MHLHTERKRVPSLVAAAGVVLGVMVCAPGCNFFTAPSATIASITVTGTAPAVGATSQFTAMAAMSDGTTEDVTNSATWSTSSNAAASVSASGLVAGVAAVTVTITATDQGISGSATITP